MGNDRRWAVFRRINWTKRDKTKIRLLLLLILGMNIIGIGVYYFQEIDRRVPSHIYLYRNQHVEIDLDVPVEGSCREAQDVISITNESGKTSQGHKFALSEPVSITANALGSYQAELKLFGLIHYKYIHFDVIEEAKVMPSGKSVGLYIQSDGIMVLGTSTIEGKDGFSYEPAKDILQPGDRIHKVGDSEVGNIDAVIAALQENGGGKVTMEVTRGKKDIRIRLETVEAADGEYKIGAWLREDTEGIGTLSFVTEENQFAALGHGITDIDTGDLIVLERGSMYPARIEDIRKGKAGKPGELIGTVLLGKDSYVGEIKSNTPLGITGQIVGEDYQYQEREALPIGLKQEVKVGRAWVLCQLGKKVEKYQIKIEEINVNSKDNKGMVLRVTDSELLKKTGGLVQGMSGAPIIQDGKVIGAITHVFVNDPTGGYATFMENML